MYQLGYIVGAIEPAAAQFRELFGIERFRVLRHSPDIATAHPWIADGVMVELVEVVPKGPAYFHPYVPDNPANAVFLHHAYRVHDEHQWNGLVAAAQRLGFEHDVVSVRTAT